MGEEIEKQESYHLETLKRIASIAHSGGLADLSEADALREIRKLSLAWWVE